MQQETDNWTSGSRKLTTERRAAGNWQLNIGQQETDNLIMQQQTDNWTLENRKLTTWSRSRKLTTEHLETCNWQLDHASGNWQLNLGQQKTDTLIMQQKYDTCRTAGKHLMRQQEYDSWASGSRKLTTWSCSRNMATEHLAAGNWQPDHAAGTWQLNIWQAGNWQTKNGQTGN